MAGKKLSDLLVNNNSLNKTTDRLYTVQSGVGGYSTPQDIADSIEAMINSYPLQQTAFVSKAGNDTFGRVGRIDLPFLTIQAAIDAITDASTTKRYMVKVFSGDYPEHLTMKDYVYVEGENTAACRVTGTSGTLVTMAGVNSRISEFSLNLTSAANGSKCIDATAGGFVLARNMDFNIESSTAGSICQFIDIDCDLIIMGDFAMTANMTGTNSTVNEKRYFEVNGSTVSSIARFAMTINDDDEADHINAIYDSSTARTKIEAESIIVNATNVTYSGDVHCYEPAGTGSAPSILSVESIVATSAGNGVCHAIHMDSGGSGIAEIRGSTISVTGFTTNQAYYIASGDTLYAFSNVIDAATPSTILGSLRTFDYDVTSGEFTLYGADLDINGKHLHNVGNINFQKETCQIASGILTCTSSILVVQAETGTTDNLDGITASDFGDGDTIYLYQDVGDTITIKNNQSVGANLPLITSHGGNTVMRDNVVFAFQLYNGAFREILPSLYVPDNYFRISNNLTPTALLRIDATALTTGTKNLTMPNANVNLGLMTAKVGTPVADQIGVWTGDGTLKGVDEVAVKTVEIDASTSGSLTVLQCSGTIINNYDQAASDVALALPTAESGLNFIATIGTTQAGNTWKLTADTNDKIYLDGVAGVDNQSVIVTPAIGNYITGYTFQTGASSWDWAIATGQGVWTAGV